MTESSATTEMEHGNLSIEWKDSLFIVKVDMIWFHIYLLKTFSFFFQILALFEELQSLDIFLAELYK